MARALSRNLDDVHAHFLAIRRYKYKYPPPLPLSYLLRFPLSFCIARIMAAVSDHRPSLLNPNAPIFVPWVYRTVEDFSEEWWELVQSSPCFRDYWLQECFQEPNADEDVDLPEIEAAFDDGYKPEEKEEEDEERESKAMVPQAALKWGKHRAMPEPPKYAEKAPKVVSVKIRPRMIQQPR